MVGIGQAAVGDDVGIGQGRADWRAALVQRRLQGARERPVGDRGGGDQVARRQRGADAAAGETAGHGGEHRDMPERTPQLPGGEDFGHGATVAVAARLRK